MKQYHALGALPALALLVGCATTPRDIAPAYFALGTEPFWNLEITPEQLNFSGVDQPRTIARNPGPRRSGEERVYETAAMQVRIRTDEACSDGMSERRYRDTVTVRVGGRNWAGCGGAVREPMSAALERSTWRITAINGRPVLADVETIISFLDGRITGTTGCNRVMSSFTQARERLTFSQLSTTRMACDGPRNAQEQLATAIMRQPLTIRFGERMTMTWTAPDGSTMALRREDWD